MDFTFNSQQSNRKDYENNIPAYSYSYSKNIYLIYNYSHTASIKTSKEEYNGMNISCPHLIEILLRSLAERPLSSTEN